MALTFLPDRRIDERLIRRARGGTHSDTLGHASGNPWIIGDLRRYDLLVSEDGESLLVTEGLGSARAQVRARLNALDDADDVGRLIESVAGDGLVALSHRGDQWLAGSVTGTVSIHWANIGAAPIAADSSSALAKIAGLNVSLDRVAMSMHDGLPFFPFGAQPLWDGVTRVRPHDMVVLSGTSAPLTRRWWHPPAPSLGSVAGARGVREALHHVLDDVAGASHRVGCDLSGGLDSTSVAYALTERGHRPDVFHARSVNRDNDDIDWARRAADELGLPLTELSTLGGGARAFELHAPSDAEARLTDAPIVWNGSRGYLDELDDAYKSAGPTTHFTGVGGDELFGTVPALPWSISRERGSAALRTLRTFARTHRLSIARTIRGALDRASFSESLQRLSSALENADHFPAELPGSWFEAAPWPLGMTETARSHALRGIGATGTSWLVELDPDRSRHQMFESLTFQGQVLSQIRSVYGSANRWDSPFLKRVVVEAVLRIPMSYRIHDQVTKPILAAAMAPAMPRAYFTRPVSGEYSADSYREFSRRRESLVTGLRRSFLAEADLLSIDRIQAVASIPSPPPEAVAHLERIVAVENWLKTAAAHGVGL